MHGRARAAVGAACCGLWRDELLALRRGAVRGRRRTRLFVAYYASAELGCFLALGWPMPARILDLFAEFRATTNGLDAAVRPRAAGRPAVARPATPWPPTRRPRCATWRMRGGPYAAAERRAILDYCASRRGRAGRAAPACCRQSSPASAALASRSAKRCCAAATWPPPRAWSGPASRSTPRCWHASGRAGPGSRRELIAEVDARYGVYEGSTFKADRFAAYLAANGIPWPRLPSRRAGARRRHLPRPGQGLAAAAAAARAAPRPGRAAA